MGSDGVLPAWREVTISTFQVKVQTGGNITGTRASPQAPVTFTPCAFIVIRADDANAATINWGWNQSASDPLAKGETVAVDIPVGYYLDVSKICVVGTAADSIHVVAGVIEGLSPNQ